MIHVVMLIIAIVGQPERIALVLNDSDHTGMAECHRLGEEGQGVFTAQAHGLATDFSYRCVPAIALPVRAGEST